MGSISRQFFALPGELVEFAEILMSEFNLFLVIMQLFPEVRVFVVEGFNELEKLSMNLEDVFCIFLGQVTPNLNVRDRYDFLQQNPDFLTIDFGKVDIDGLAESRLSGMTDNPELQKLWEKIGRKLRNMTKSGIWGINTELGGKHLYRDLRYTLGVEEFCRKGGHLLSHGTFIRFSIDEPQPHD